MNLVLLSAMIPLLLFGTDDWGGQILLSSEPLTTTKPTVSGPAMRIVVNVMEATIDQSAAETLDLQAIDPGHHQVEKLLAGLRQMGQADLTASFDSQIIMGAKPIKLESGQKVPFVTGVVAGKSGTVSQIQYQDIGISCEFGMIPKGNEPGFDISSRITWSGLVSSDVSISENIYAPIHQTAEINTTLALQEGVPLIMSTSRMLPTQGEAKKKTQLIIVRIVAMPSSGL
jgi:hypothetical protein